MNHERLEQAVNIMKRAGKVGMRSWQCTPGDPGTSERELHTCRTPACFAGWIAVSPEFRAAGGEISRYSGAPIFKERLGCGQLKNGWK